MAAPATMAVPHVNGSFYLNKNLSDPQEEILALQNFPYFLRQIAKIATIKLSVKSDHPQPVGDTTHTRTVPPRITLTTGVSKLGWLGEAPLKAVGLSATKSETRPLDGTEFVDEEPVIGRVVGKMWVVRVADLGEEEEGRDDAVRMGQGEKGAAERGGEEVENGREEGGLDEFLLQGWSSPDDFVIRLRARSDKANDPEPWVADHVWGFQVTGKGTSDGEAKRYVSKARVTKTIRATGEKRSGNCRLVHDFAG